MRKCILKVLVFFEIMSVLEVLLEFCGISLIINTLSIFLVACILILIISFILFIVSKKFWVLISTIVVSLFLIFVMPFTIGYKRNFTKISSKNNKNTVLIMEYNRPINAGVNIYKQVYPCIYILEKKDSLKTSYYPFSRNEITVNWNDNNNEVVIQYKRAAENSEYSKARISFN